MTLRIGLLADSVFVRAWAATLAERLSALEGVEIAALVLGDQPAPRSLLDAYLAFERRRLRGVPDLARPTDLRKILPRVPLLSPQAARENPPDLWVSFQESPARELPARLGCWTWNDISATAGFYEVFQRLPLTTCELSARLPDGERKILRRAVFATDWLSAARNRNRVYLKAQSTLLWALKKLALRGGAWWDEGGEAARPRRDVRLFHLAALPFKQAARALEKKFRPLETWLVFAERDEGGLLPKQEERVKLAAPPGCYWADPIGVERRGATYLFVEEYEREKRRGRIVCLRLDKNARVVSRQIALETDCHLSYPFVFEHQGETYLIPESSARRSVELYHCINFPDRWEFVQPLLKDVYAVDSTLLERDGRWWLFANVKTDPGASSWDELHLFFADSPLADKWTPHPLNPVVSDARFARPAGPFFIRDGILYRPSQDSSRRYGCAVNLNRVDVLNEREYAETCVGKILPRAGLLAAHTYSRAGGWIFSDGVTRNPEKAQ